MKTRKTNILIVIALTLAMLFSMSAVFADTSNPGLEGSESIGVRTVNGCTSSFDAESSSRAVAEVGGTSSGFPSFITSKITLQSAPLGTSYFSDVWGVNPETYTVYNDTSILHCCYFPINSNRTFRIKIELTDDANGYNVTTRYFQGLAY